MQRAEGTCNDMDDLTFTYTVPDTVYKVPDRPHHASKIVCGYDILGCMVKDGEVTFYDQIRDAFEVKQLFDSYSARIQREKWMKAPAPLGSAESSPAKSGSPTYNAFEKSYDEAVRGLRTAGRSCAAPEDESGLWIPLKF